MLYSYKMTHDKGFAPNPFHDLITLATCKAHIRLHRKKDDYIAGLTSKYLCNDPVGSERLVFIMLVTDKITFQQYWNDAQYDRKKTDWPTAIGRCGDNIYAPLQQFPSDQANDFRQIRNPFHTTAQKGGDLSGKFVLLSNDFFYFGEAAVPLFSFKIRKPIGVAKYGQKTDDENEVNKLWLYLSNNFPKNKPLAMPFGFRGEMENSTALDLLDK